MLESQAPLRTRSRALRTLLILFLILVTLLAGATGFYLWATGASGPNDPVTIEIAQGATPADVGTQLHEASVIRSPFMFRLVVRMRGIGASIQAGRYALETNMELSATLDALERGPIIERPPLQVTIPEGLRLEQVAPVVAEALPVGRRAFVKQATNGSWSLPPYLPEGTPSVEGFLFPKTYDFEEDINARDVIERLLAQFEEEVAGLPWDNADGLGVDPYEVVVIASLIEREARYAPDRDKIAGVIYNRLELGMPLQIDATVQYALPEHKERLTFDDYEYESPYNTYLNAGIPPGPIASPGLDSLRAALEPADVDFLYYLLIDPETGEHVFAETLEEHNQNRQEAGLG